MSAQHTPGPWAVFEYGVRPGIETDREGDTFSIVVWGHGSDEEGVHGSTPEEALANARLIAAAPDLLQATVALMGLLLTDPRYKGSECLDIARAALSRALGEGERS